MPIQVHFRGPALYLSDGKCSHGAWVPDGERLLFSDDGVPGKHPDGTDSTPHYAGLLVVESEVGDQKELFRASLRKKIVTLYDGADDECIVNESFKDLVRIDQYAHAGRPGKMSLISVGQSDFWVRVATRVRFHGGTLGSEQLSAAAFFFLVEEKPTEPERRPLSAVWAAKSDVVRILVTDPDGSNSLEIWLREGQHAYLFNWDSRTPTAEELGADEPCQQIEHPEEDVDFKWLYELFVPPVATYKQWLRGGPLPAPKTNCKLSRPGQPIPPSPGSSGCVPGYTIVKNAEA